MRPLAILLVALACVTGCAETFAIAECRDACSRHDGGYMIGHTPGTCMCGPLPDAVIDGMAASALKDAGK